MENIFSTAYNYLRTFAWVDVLDILIAAFLIYQVLKFVRGTSVESVLRGIIVLILVYFLADFLQLNVIHYILANTMQIGLVAVLIMFQPELRKMLESLGRSKLSTLLRRDEDETDIRIMIREVVDACSSMSWSRTGALIVFERNKPLDEILTAATELDAKTTSELVKNISSPVPTNPST